MMTKIFIVNVREPIDCDTFNFLMQFVGGDKRERILKHKIKQDADNMLIGEILAKAAIKSVFGIGIGKQNFVYGKNQKPYLLNFSGVFFNISHSGKMVACAVSDKPVGVDIQQITSYKEKTAQRVCNESELKKIAESDDEASEFAKIWSKKEAFLKKSGDGITISDIKDCILNTSVKSERIGDYWLSCAEQKTILP